ncbi:hypothetical protein QAD02_001290 [Eretmocerus hayati]|uniref:Uncharacterized protein n=1 Tax=Eretmocerus hayati TaxID=131215 RepID=A0ACC2NHC7_9HYME|nr:hypothetical protein QAD02_001290 [Eretmocerus hayati]
MEELRFQIIDNLKKLDKKNNKSKNKKKKQYFISPNFTPKLQSQFEQFYPKNEVCKSIKHSDEAKKRDECRKGFSPDGKFDGYRSIYSQPLRREVSWGVHGLHLTSATVALTGLAKHSNIFGRNYSFEETKSLLKNDDATFVGALFLKFLIVIESRLTHIYLFNPINNLEERLKTPERLGAIGGIEASIAIKSLGFLTIFDCAPNAHTSGTYDNKHVMYALHPIKKGTPITTSLCSIYQMYRKKPERQAIYFEFYNRPCECQACKEDWLKDIGPVEKILESDKSKPENIKKLDEEIRLIEIELKKSNSLNFPDTKLLSRAKTAVAKSWKYFPMPSLVTCKAVHLLNLVSDRLLRPWDLDPEKLSLCAN